MEEPATIQVDSSARVSTLLKEGRKRAGLSQGVVARKLGYRSAQIISNWERGLSRPPKGKIIELSRIYKLEPKIVFLTVAESFVRTFVKALPEPYKRFIAQKILLKVNEL